MLYQRPEGSSIPGKPVLPLRQVNVPAIYTEANHKYRLSIQLQYYTVLTDYS